MDFAKIFTGYFMKKIWGIFFLVGEYIYSLMGQKLIINYNYMKNDKFIQFGIFRTPSGSTFKTKIYI